MSRVETFYNSLHIILLCLHLAQDEITTRFKLGSKYLATFLKVFSFSEKSSRDTVYVNLPAQLQYLAMLVAFTCINNHLKNGSLPLIFITHKWSKIIIYLTQLTTRSTGVVSGRSFGSSVVSLACITSVCSVQRFPGGHSLYLALGSSFYPHPSHLYSSTDKSVWQASGSIGVGAHGWRALVCQQRGQNSV